MPIPAPVTMPARAAPTYAEAAAELFALQGRGVKLGLENVRGLLDELGAPDRRFRIVQVAGTNGKGSTSAYLAAGLRAARRRVGLFTSPHLVDFRERVCVDGRPITEDEVVRAWCELRGEVERRNMTFFEANTVLALLHFARSGCDVAVLETGMGGRLDATTATEAALCVLTPIAFDHREYLGRTLGAIAGEKAAILRGGAPGFSAPQAPAAERVIRERAAAAGSELTFVPRPEDVRVESAGTELRWRGERLRLRMVGRHQAHNAVLALEALLALLPGARPRELAAAVEPVEVPGRFQRVARPAGELVLDVAHNPDALRCVARTLAEVYPGREKRALVGMLRDKDLAGSLAVLARVEGVRGPLLVGSAASSPPARRLRRADWLRVPAELRGQWAGGIAEGLARLDAWQARAPGRVVAVVGSFTSVGDAMALLGLDPLPG
jgi:dihydrofolate synthase/folylpolyglutamate synthase